MSDWRHIISQTDIDELFSVYGAFHDGCIVSVCYQSGNTVDEKLSMHFGDAASQELHIIFQRQGRPKTIELCFTGVHCLYLTGWQNGYSSEILDAYLSFHHHLLPGEPQDLIVWANTSDFDVNTIGHTPAGSAVTYIAASALKWRFPEK